MKTIYDLELHETLVTGSFLITRVPGGWIYYHKLAVFVPWDNEFQSCTTN